MKLIIDIPEEDYKRIVDYYNSHEIVDATYSYIKNGTPLDSVIKDMKKESTEPTGHWIEHYNPEAEICMQHMSECSVCGKMICGRYNIYKNFCPNCGEKMEEQKTT